jgi:hypothetical protein
MSAVPAARFLAEFDVGGDVGPLGPGGIEPAGNASAAVSAQLEEAFARGVEDGTAAARAELDAKLEEQRGLFEAELAAARQEWAAGAGERLAASMLAALSELQTRIAEAVARVLKPFVAERLQAQTMAELQAGIDVLVSTDAGAGFHISGPADVLDAVRERLAGKPVAVAYTASADCDVRIVAGQATLETRLGDWLAQLNEAVP